MQTACEINSANASPKANSIALSIGTDDTLTHEVDDVCRRGAMSSDVRKIIPIEC